MTPMPRGRPVFDRYDQDQAEAGRPCSRQPPELCESARTITDPADGPARREPGLTPRAFCVPCETRIVTSLGSLPVMYAGLAVRIGDPARTGTAVRVPPGSRVLLNPEIDAQLRVMAAVLAGWAARVRSVPGLQLTDPDHQHDTPEGVEEACGTLARHATPLLALQPGWMTRVYTYPFGAPIPPELEDEIGDEEIVAAGDGWVKVTTRLDGTSAGNEILGLHWRARKLLGWTKPAPESFDGVPCQACDEMTLERAEPPSDPDIPADHSRCAACQHTMSREVFGQWAERYATWARGAGVQECRRCGQGNHLECSWVACSCAMGEHPRRRAAALPERYLTCRGVQGIMTEGEVSPERARRPGLCHV